MKARCSPRRYPSPAATVTGEPTGATTQRLIGLINQVSPEEFRWQETNYDRDSALGRELLFRIAHNEWIRATAEVIDVMRTDAVDTTIKIEIDPGAVPLGLHGRLLLIVLLSAPASAGCPSCPSRRDAVLLRFLGHLVRHCPERSGTAIRGPAVIDVTGHRAAPAAGTPAR